jgi:tetratricopeptide (TPR) repeat protein
MTAAPAWAAGSDPCEKYRQGSKKWKKCKGYSFVPDNPSTDDEIYQAGYWLAKNGRFGDAIVMLKRAENQKDPRILNYLGFASRKLGRIDQGLAYYRRALTADPNYVLAREYMGEAFLQKGDIASAQEQLNEIGKRCGTLCTSYAQLSDLIANTKL